MSPFTVIHFHCHHFDLLYEFLSYAQSALNRNTNRLVVTYSDGNLAGGLAASLSGIGIEYQTVQVPNVGRNFGALWTLLNLEDFSDIDIWAYFHSKKSPHLD